MRARDVKKLRFLPPVTQALCKYIDQGIENMPHQKRDPLSVLAHTFQVISFLLFFVCLSQKGFYDSTTDSPKESLLLLMIGILGPLDGIFAWFANPILFVAYLFFYLKRFNWSIFFGVIAFLLISSFFLNTTVIVNEGGTRAEVIGYGLGFWLWMASSVFSITAALIEKINQTLKA